MEGNSCGPGAAKDASSAAILIIACPNDDERSIGIVTRASSPIQATTNRPSGDDYEIAVGRTGY